MANSRVYLLCSDDPLLKNEKSEALVHEALSSHTNPEFLLFTYSDFKGEGGSSNLARLENELKDLGFFCDFRVIKIYLKDLDKIAVEVLECIAANAMDSMLIIVDLPRVNTIYTKVTPKNIHDKDKGKTPGLETRKKNAIAYILGARGEVLSMYPPDINEMPAWIMQRCRLYGFNIDNNTAAYLSQRCEGNLVTIDQSLKIMQITCPNKIIDINAADAFFNQDSRYSGFEFTDALLNAQSQRALNILDALLKEQVSIASVVLSLILSRLDEALKTIVRFKKEQIHKKDYSSKSRFFLSHNIKMLKTQQAITKAAVHMPDELIDYIAKELSQASYDFSCFDFTKVILSLQRMAVAMRNFQAMQLCQTR